MKQSDGWLLRTWAPSSRLDDIASAWSPGLAAKPAAALQCLALFGVQCCGPASSRPRISDARETGQLMCGAAHATYQLSCLR